MIKQGIRAGDSRPNPVLVTLAMAGLQLHHRMGMKGYTQGIVEGNGSAIFFWRESGSGLAIKGDGVALAPHVSLALFSTPHWVNQTLVPG